MVESRSLAVACCLRHQRQAQAALSSMRRTVVRHESKRAGNERGLGPMGRGHRPRPRTWLRAWVAGLAMVAGLALPTAPSPAWALPVKFAYVANQFSDNVSVINT